MKQEPFTLKSGMHKICINPINVFPDKKPAIRIECVENYSDTTNIDGEWIEEIDSAMYVFRTIEEFDLFLNRLEEMRSFLNNI